MNRKKKEFKFSSKTRFEPKQGKFSCANVPPQSARKRLLELALWPSQPAYGVV